MQLIHSTHFCDVTKKLDGIGAIPTPKFGEAVELWVDQPSVLTVSFEGHGRSYIAG